MRVLLFLALALGIAACGASERIQAPGAEVGGTFESNVGGDSGALGALRVAPPEGGEADADIARIIHTSLERRGYTHGGDTPLTLRYITHRPLTDRGDEGLGIAVGASVGSSSGGNEIGFGLDLPFLSGSDSVRQVSFLFELALEDADGALLWRGRATGRTHISGDSRFARPVAPMLLDRLGRETARPRPGASRSNKMFAIHRLRYNLLVLGRMLRQGG